jgi:hypothetical protein
MAKKTNGTLERLQAIEAHLIRLEKAVLAKTDASQQGGETEVPPWKFLVSRRHPWRKQLYLKGRNLTARQLVGSMHANAFDEAAAAANYHLPVEAVHEAVAYVQANAELLQTESEIERLMLKRDAGGIARGPQPVS